MTANILSTPMVMFALLDNPHSPFRIVSSITMSVLLELKRYRSI